MKRIEFLAILFILGCGSNDPQPLIIEQDQPKPEFWTDKTVRVLTPILGGEFEKSSKIKIQIELKELSHKIWPEAVVANLEGKAKSSKNYL